MKLLAFRIQNFRSIVDTGWSQLSPDNITGLIGQNESGKTSILEALNSFYEGSISEDILRSDLSMPVVSCKFDITDREFNKILNEKELPSGVSKCVKDQNTITLERLWNEDFSSRIELSGEEIIELYEIHNQKFHEKDEKIQAEIDRILELKEKVLTGLKTTNWEKEEISEEFATTFPSENSEKR